MSYNFEIFSVIESPLYPSAVALEQSTSKKSIPNILHNSCIKNVLPTPESPVIINDDLVNSLPISFNLLSLSLSIRYLKNIVANCFLASG